MRLCRFDNDQLGVVVGDKVYNVTEVQDRIRDSAPYDMKGDAVIAALPLWCGRIKDLASRVPGRPLADVRLLSPVARPSKVIAAPTNYHTHIDEMASRTDIPDASQRPPPKIGLAGLFLKANSAIVGPSEGIPLRFPNRLNEHELEFVVIIGKQGTDISKENAFDHVACYCLGLDMTVRGQEDRSFRKSCDGYAVLGPWIVTSDEIRNPNGMSATLHVGGELRQTAKAGQMIYDIGRLIEFASSFYTLYPGDVIYTGTPAGVGRVKPGDVISVQCEEIGMFNINVRAHTTR